MARGERRRSGAAAPLPSSYDVAGARRSRAEAAGWVFDAETGFYTLPALAEFIQYEIDGASQMTRNELMVSPLCVTAIAVDGLEACTDEHERADVVEKVSAALRVLTRKADRVARHEQGFVALLRRTMAKNVHEWYAPRLAEQVAETATMGGSKVTLSIGIAGLIEHVIKGPDDMVRKAFRALKAAQERGPGTAAVYDFGTMPLE